MANVQKTIEIIFGSVDNLSGGLGDIKSGFNSLDASARQLASPFAAIATSVLALDAVLITTGATLTGFAIQQAGGFSDSVAEIGTLFDGTADQVDQLSGNLLDFSKEAVFAIDDINAATFTAISTGTDWRDVTDLLAESQKLAVVGATSLGDSTAVLTRAMNAYGAETSEAERFSEALFTTAQRGDTNLTKLAAALGLVVADAAAAGVPIEVLGSAVSALTVGAIDTNRSMTLLKSLFRELLNPTDELKTALGGVAFNGDNLQEVMQQLKISTGGTAAEMGLLFGSQESVSAALILSNDAAGTFADTLDAMSDSTQSVAENYETMANKFDLANQRLKNSIKAAFIETGLPLLDEYGSGINALSKIVNEVTFAFNAGAFDPVYDLLEELLQKVSTNLNNVAENIGEALDLVDFNGLAVSLEALGGSISDVFIDLFGEIDTSNPEELAAGIQRAVNILEQLVDVTKGIVDFFQPIFNAIGEAASEIDEAGLKADESTGKFLGAMLLLKNFGPVALAAMEGLRLAGDDIRNVFNVIVGGIKAAFNTLQVIFDTVVLSVIVSVNKLLGAVDLLTFGETNDDVKAFRLELEYLAKGIQENQLKNMGELKEGLDQVGAGLTGTRTAAQQARFEEKLLADETKRLAEEAKRAATDFKSLNSSVLEGSKIVDDSGDVFGIVGDSLVNLSEAARAAGVDVDLMADNMASAASSADTTAAGIGAIGVAVKDSVSIFSIFNDELRKTDPELADIRDTMDDSITVTRGLNDELVFTDAVLHGVGSSAGDAAKGLELTKDKAAEMLLKLEQIDSNERIKNIEARVSLNIAQIESDTQKALAAFDSINVGITSTGEVISEALGILGGLDANTRVYNDILKILREEVELRKETFELQRRMTEEQIDNLRERTKALSKGVTLLIYADARVQEIQAFMYKIVQKIHATAVGDEAEFLLSLGGGT